jgi:outer membrane protein
MNNSFSRFFPIRAALAAISLLAASCAVHQKDEIATYRQVIDGNKPAEVHVDLTQVLTLTDALRLANQNEEQLSIQGESYLQALIAKDQAFSAFLPTASFGPSYSISSKTNNNFGSANHNFSAPVSASMNLFNGFRDYHSLKAADATIEQRRQLVLDLQQTVLLDVAQTYYQVLTSEQSVEVLTNSVAVQQKNVDYIEAQAKVGLSIALDVAQAQAQLSQTQVSLNQSRADVRNARITLAFLLDAPIQDNPLRDDYEPPEQTSPLEQWEAVAESNRQDLLASNKAVEAARHNVEVAFGQYYPTLNLNLNYTLGSDALGGGGAWDGLLSLDLPLFTGGLIQAQVRQAWSEFRQAVLTQVQLRRSIDEAVQTAYTNLELAHQQLAELEVQVKAARDALYLAQTNYRTGRGTLLNALIAQDTLLSTQLQLTTEQFTQKTAYFNLLRTAGQLKLTMGHPTTQPEEQRLRHLATEPVTLPSTRP